jgi:hypothetical protein
MKIDPPLPTESPQHLGCLRPQRAVTFFAAFAEQSELIWPRELKVVCPDVDHLLDAGASIEHRGQQRVVPTPIRGGPVDLSEHCFDLRAIEVFDDALVRPFEGDAEHALSPLHVIGMVRSHITEKGVDGGEPDIPRRYRIITILLQMGKKCQDLVRLKVLQVQVAHIAPSIRSGEAK